MASKNKQSIKMHAYVLILLFKLDLNRIKFNFFISNNIIIITDCVDVFTY